MGRTLADGVYEELITRAVEEAIEADGGRRVVKTAALDAGDAHVRLARFLRDELERALASVRASEGEDRVARQVALANEVLALLGALNGQGKTILMVTHDPRAAESASRLVHLDKGLLTDAGH